MAEAREILCAENLEGVPHGFLTGIGCEGEPDAGLLVEGGKLALVKQVHSARVVKVDAPFENDQRPEADAMVSDVPGLVLGIVTADCAPVLFADRAASVIGAAHAGWRGAHAGVLENTVEAMVALGADRSRIAAAVGPCIHQPSYEVDEGFRERFADQDAEFFASGREGHWQFDLPGYVLERLRRAGITAAADVGIDTYTDETRFHSYRRATHRGEDATGRQFSLIALPE